MDEVDFRPIEKEINFHSSMDDIDPEKLDKIYVQLLE